MMDHKNLPNRQSIRLQGYDYSYPGFYFVTICTYRREHLFGKVVDGKMILSEFGEIAFQFWSQTESRHPNVRADEFIIMPNHLHGIIEIINPDLSVKAIHESPVPIDADKESIRKYRRSMLIPKIMGWYKMNSSKKINILRQTPGKKIWHRNYYDHIIRNEEALFYIREYIKNNPLNWEKDRFRANHSVSKTK
jgi:REP element-mobilizing transposase RayT